MEHLGDDLLWSKDSKATYLHASFVDDGCCFFGATPEDVSLMHVEVSSGNLYSFGLQQ